MFMLVYLSREENCQCIHVTCVNFFSVDILLADMRVCKRNWMNPSSLSLTFLREQLYIFLVSFWVAKVLFTLRNFVMTLRSGI
jgi:hypothetical protein